MQLDAVRCWRRISAPQFSAQKRENTPHRSILPMTSIERHFHSLAENMPSANSVLNISGHFALTTPKCDTPKCGAFSAQPRFIAVRRRKYPTTETMCIMGPLRLVFVVGSGHIGAVYSIETAQPWPVAAASHRSRKGGIRKGAS